MFGGFTRRGHGRLLGRDEGLKIHRYCYWCLGLLVEAKTEEFIDFYWNFFFWGGGLDRSALQVKARQS